MLRNCALCTCNLKAIYKTWSTYDVVPRVTHFGNFIKLALKLNGRRTDDTAE